MIKIIGLFGVEGPKQEGFFYCSSLYQNFYCLERRSQVTTTPIWHPHQKISQPSENLPWIIQHTAAAPGHLIPLGALIPQNTRAKSLQYSPEYTKVFCMKTWANGLSVSVMAVFTASEGGCVLQVVCKRSGNNMWGRSVSMGLFIACKYIECYLHPT